MAMRLRTRRWTSSRTSSPGSDTSSTARANGRAASRIRPCCGKTLLQPPARDVGERQQPQRLAGRRAVDDDHVVLAGLVVALDLQQAEQLVHAGRDRELLGADAVDAALDEQVAEPVLHAGPVALHLLLGGDLLAPQPRRRPAPAPARARLAARRASECAGSVRQHDRPQARGGAAARRGGGDRRLADAALARVEDRARGIAKEREPSRSRSVLRRGPRRAATAVTCAPRCRRGRRRRTRIVERARRCAGCKPASCAAAAQPRRAPATTGRPRAHAVTVDRRDLARRDGTRIARRRGGFARGFAAWQRERRGLVRRRAGPRSKRCAVSAVAARGSGRRPPRSARRTGLRGSRAAACGSRGRTLRRAWSSSDHAPVSKCGSSARSSRVARRRTAPGPRRRWPASRSRAGR